MRKDRFTDEALAAAKALAELKYSENPEDQLAFSEAYDFARCQRPDGSFYPIPDGKECRKGSKAEDADLKLSKKSKSTKSGYQPFPKGKVDKKLAKTTLKAAIAQLKETWGSQDNSAEKRKKLKELYRRIETLLRITTGSNTEATVRSRKLKKQHAREVKKKIMEMDRIAKEKKELYEKRNAEAMTNMLKKLEKTRVREKNQ